MQKRLLIANDQILSKEQTEKLNITQLNDINSCMTILTTHTMPITVIIAYPSNIDNAQELIDYIAQHNNYIFAVTVMLLTDNEHIDNDIKFLNSAVSDCIMLPLNIQITKNRLELCERLTSSVSFSEFAKMLKALPANIYLKDANGRYVFSSQIWDHLKTNGDPNWSIQGKTDLDIRKDKDNAIIAMEADQNLIRSRKGTSYIIEEHKGTNPEFLQIIKEPLFFPDGRVRGIIGLINKVTEQELLRRELHERSTHDQMTGLYNRMYLDEYLNTLKDTKPFPIGIISADCDHLKMINDSYGHSAGDNYIKLCAALMSDTLPKTAKVFRTGGDEFMAFLPNTTLRTTRSLINTMKQNAKSYGLKNQRLSVSFGCTAAETIHSDIAECIRLSDEDMYRDKNRKTKR